METKCFIVIDWFSVVLREEAPPHIIKKSDPYYKGHNHRNKKAKNSSPEEYDDTGIHLKKMKTTPKKGKKKPAIKKMSKKKRFHRERKQALRQQRLMMKFLEGQKAPSLQQPKTKRKRTQPQQIEDADETPPRKKTDIRNRDAPT